MPFNADSILFIQGAMKRARKYDGPLDGVLNEDMRAATSDIPQVKKTWPLQRCVVAYVQKLAGLKGDDVDGLWGDQTEQAYAQLIHQRLYHAPETPWRPEDRVDLDPNNWPSHKNNDNEVVAVFGRPGPTANLKKFVPPYAHFLAWDPAVRAKSFQCNVRVHDSLSRVLTKVLEIYGEREIERLRLDQFGGCYNDRPMRGGTRRSTHSWGIALDYDPVNNQLKWGADRATFARPEYRPWFECWETEGWVSLGRTKNFDWMHVQAAKV